MMTQFTGLDDVDARLLREALDAMRALKQARTWQKEYETAVRKLDPSASDYGKMGALRRWLLDHECYTPQEGLVDGELGLVAWLAYAGESEVWEPPSAIRARDPSLYRRLEELGAFAVDAARVRDLVAHGHLAEADVAPFRRPVERTRQLRIEATKGEKP
jgi:hypothetical protein